MRKLYEPITDASSPVKKSVAYECRVSRSTEKWLCQFPRNDLVVLLDISLHYFIPRINWVNKTISKRSNWNYMWFGESHPFHERGSPAILSTSGQQRYEGWSCIMWSGATRAIFTHGSQGPGPRAANFQGRHIKKESRLKYGMRKKKRLSTREKFKGDLYRKQCWFYFVS